MYIYLHMYIYINVHIYINIHTEHSIYTYCEQNLKEQICSCKFTYLILYTEKYIWGTK